MNEGNPSLLTDAEEILRKRFFESGNLRPGLPSNAAPIAPSPRIESLVIPDEMRGSMPLTKSKYLVKENPHLVQWEREVRKFLRKLSPEHEHRISAIMVYEWATGIRIADIMELEKQWAAQGKAGPYNTWRSDLRKINKLLTFYFGKPYMTYITGRKVPRAYRVRVGYLIRRHRPQTLTLWAEYTEGVLNP